ncbi:hypothetical protein [Streptomyces dangxiongensis]|uniref:hypothetical protein n=1 Tax=Streptomyces dangxiongensis TaxID=1442032 RepID=UPI0013CEC7E1|nr:hypothetical protein [Streptomyces dangxiongensis]
MSSPLENEASSPLEEVTGEKDVHPEEEGRQPESASGTSRDEEDGGATDAGDTSTQAGT